MRSCCAGDGENKPLAGTSRLHYYSPLWPSPEFRKRCEWTWNVIDWWGAKYWGTYPSAVLNDVTRQFVFKVGEHVLDVRRRELTRKSGAACRVSPQTARKTRLLVRVTQVWVESRSRVTLSQKPVNTVRKSLSGVAGVESWVERDS